MEKELLSVYDSVLGRILFCNQHFHNREYHTRFEQDLLMKHPTLNLLCKKVLTVSKSCCACSAYVYILYWHACVEDARKKGMCVYYLAFQLRSPLVYLCL